MSKIWISTTEARRLSGMDCCDKTFRNKMREHLETRTTTGGKLLWNLDDVRKMTFPNGESTS
jgi:hypothetical protein